jgi:hypothetical protein
MAVKEKEIVIGPLTYAQATKFVTNLRDKSGRFMSGAYNLIGTADFSYGKNKKIGFMSFDKKIRCRMDYDPNPKKGVHYNYEDFSNPDTAVKYCILISDMNKEQYIKYIDRMNKGLSGIELDYSRQIKRKAQIVNFNYNFKCTVFACRRKSKLYPCPYNKAHIKKIMDEVMKKAA